MCVASATAPDLVELVMKRFGMDAYFSKVFSCAESGRGKEFPDVFLEAKDFLGAPIEETWVFEDSYAALRTAHNAGFPTVGVYDRYNFSQDVVREHSTVYIGEGESLLKLLEL